MGLRRPLMHRCDGLSVLQSRGTRSSYGFPNNEENSTTTIPSLLHQRMSQRKKHAGAASLSMQVIGTAQFAPRIQGNWGCRPPFPSALTIMAQLIRRARTRITRARTTREKARYDEKDENENRNANKNDRPSSLRSAFFSTQRARLSISYDSDGSEVQALVMGTRE
ncbi:hypothetical protein BDN70DRAFT_193371 [Pholiota conissans]|uniref:Uncharacterized protein n=1 Tax=Pholiota conissans TaxID=109636 RepID=A0A9P5YUW6_9AGAR|nr:hypothetical protein BDN70DRAFT_193371 [Pholiota conissans]